MVALMFCSAIAVGCGDDDDSGNTSDAGDSGSAGEDAGNDGGGGGAPGTGGRTGGTGGMTMTAMPVKCGTSMCQSPGGGLIPPGFLAAACCADEAKNQCGSMMGGMCKPPPPVDTSCPSIMIPVVGSVGSCCAGNGMCGLDGSLLSMGCVDYEMVKSALGVLGGVITLPEAQKCGDMDQDAAAMGDLDASTH